MNPPNGKSVLTPEQSRRLVRLEDMIREMDETNARNQEKAREDLIRQRRELFLQEFGRATE